METALLRYFVLDTQLRSTCDFNPYVLSEGITIYEVIRVEQGVPLFLEEHIERFFSSAFLENISLNISRKLIRKALHMLIKENRMVQGNVKFLFHRDTAGQSRFLAWAMPFFYPSPEQYAQGVVVGTMAAERPNPNAKKALYDLRQRADRLIKEKKWWEVIYVNRQGLVTEGSRSNLFFVEGHRLLTPELLLVLPGITRAKLMELARKQGMEVAEAKIRADDIPLFDACFLTGTSPKVLPVRQWEGHKLDVNNTFMRRLMKAYDDLVADEVARGNKE